MGKYYREGISKGVEDSLVRIYDKEKLIGLVSVCVFETLTKKTLVFENFIIDEDYRNKGHGTKLLNKILHLAKIWKVDCIEATTKESNKAAQGLYESFDFKDRENKALRLWLQ